ncbi:MAG: DUF4091 domain-containing protein [Leptospirales bacterium]
MKQGFRKFLDWLCLTAAIGFLGVVALATGLILSPGLREWTMEKARLIDGSYHPVAAIKNLAVSFKNQIKSKKSEPAFLARTNTKHGFPGSYVERHGPLTSWISPSSDRVNPSEIPPSGSVNNGASNSNITITGLKGETISLQLVLLASRHSPNIHVSLLQSGSKSVSSCISVHRFLEVYQRFQFYSNGHSGALQKIVTTDPLVPFHDPYVPGKVVVDHVSLDSNTSQPVWIDVRYARSCPAGSYTGTLIVTEGEETLRKSPVTFQILDATLPRSTHLARWMQLYIGRFWHGESIASGDEFNLLYKRYVLLGHKYGFSVNDAGSIQPSIQWDWNTGKINSVDWSKYDQLMAPILSGDLTGRSPNVWCLPIRTYSLGDGNWGGFTIQGGTPSMIENWKGIPDTATQELARVIVAHWKEKGWPIKKGFVYLWDEPEHQLYYPDVYKLIAASAHSLHKGSDGKIQVMVTDAPYIWSKHQIGHDKSVMIGNIDIWSPAGITAIPEKMQARQKKGDKAWFYQSGPPFLGQSDLTSIGSGFRMWFWTAWKYRSDGVFYWAANMWNDNTRANNPYTNQGKGDGVMFYPGKQLHFLGYPDIEGPLPSVRMAQWRRGYEDYRYMVLLKRLGKKNEADKSVNTLVRKALDDGGYIPYWRNPLWMQPGDWSHDPLKWHQARVSMAHKIAKLNEGK